MPRTSGTAGSLAASAVALLSLAGCITATPSPAPTPVDEEVTTTQSGDYNLQQAGDVTLLTGAPPSDWKILPNSLYHGQVVLTDDGCLGLSGELGDFTVIFPVTTKLIDENQIEFEGSTFQVGAEVSLGGGGAPDSALPTACGAPDHVIMASSVSEPIR